MTRSAPDANLYNLSVWGFGIADLYSSPDTLLRADIFHKQSRFTGQKTMGRMPWVSLPTNIPIVSGIFDYTILAVHDQFINAEHVG